MLDNLTYNFRKTCLFPPTAYYSYPKSEYLVITSIFSHFHIIPPPLSRYPPFIPYPSHFMNSPATPAEKFSYSHIITLQLIYSMTKNFKFKKILSFLTCTQKGQFFWLTSYRCYKMEIERQLIMKVKNPRTQLII